MDYRTAYKKYSEMADAELATDKPKEKKKSGFVSKPGKKEEKKDTSNPMVTVLDYIVMFRSQSNSMMAKTVEDDVEELDYEEYEEEDNS